MGACCSGITASFRTGAAPRGPAPGCRSCRTGSRNATQAYAIDDLSGRGSYYTGYYPVAVAAAPDDSATQPAAGGAPTLHVINPTS
jgi:hypothetical protein